MTLTSEERTAILAMVVGQKGEASKETYAPFATEVGTSPQNLDVETHSALSEEESIETYVFPADAIGRSTFELPACVGKMELPRTSDLPANSSMERIVQIRAVPGSEGVVLTDKVADSAELYGDIFGLSQRNGVEYGLSRTENGDLVLRSGAPNRVSVLNNEERSLTLMNRGGASKIALASRR